MRTIYFIKMFFFEFLFQVILYYFLLFLAKVSLQFFIFFWCNLTFFVPPPSQCQDILMPSPPNSIPHIHPVISKSNLIILFMQIMLPFCFWLAVLSNHLSCPILFPFPVWRSTPCIAATAIRWRKRDLLDYGRRRKCSVAHQNIIIKIIIFQIDGLK